MNEIKKILYSLEQHSSHPIAQSLVAELKEFEDQANPLNGRR